MPVNLHRGGSVVSATDRYTVETDDLFEGGQSKGYLVRDTAGHKLFLKMFVEPTARSPYARLFVERQLALVEKLSTVPDFVCRDVDFFEYKRVYYKVMERMEGVTLQDRLDTAAAHRAEPEYWPQSDRILNGKVLAYSIAEIHKHGLVHLDLKPDNCYLASRTIEVTGASRLVVRLLDFDGGLVDGAPPPRHIIGTANYWSPEHVKPAVFGAPGAHSDVFTLGIILYQILARRYPYVSERGYLTRAAERPKKVAPWLAPGVSDAIWHALSPSPADRPTARDLHNALRGTERTLSSAVDKETRVVLVAPGTAGTPSRRIRFWKAEPLGRDKLRGVPGYEYVAERQARIFQDGSGWVISPLATPANPTKLNDVMMESGKRYHLKEGDRITIGKLTLTVMFEVSGSA